MGKTKDVTTETTKEVCGTIFDDVFRTIAQKMPFLLIPLINEVIPRSWGKNFTAGRVASPFCCCATAAGRTPTPW